MRGCHLAAGSRARGRRSGIRGGLLIRGLDSFQYDAVTAYMQVNGSDEARPTLGVYKVYSVLSGDLSLPRNFRLRK